MLRAEGRALTLLHLCEFPLPGGEYLPVVPVVEGPYGQSECFSTALYPRQATLILLIP
jgi:hypothetical protein